MSPRLRIVVAGMLAGDPGQGGATWAALQYVLGLRQLGHEVTAVDPVPSPVTPEVRAYFAAVCDRFGLAGAAVLLSADGGARDVDEAVLRRIREADLLVNLSGRWRDLDVLASIPVRVYVDLDPGFTQLWHETGADVGLSGHTHHVSVGTGIGGQGCRVPSAGVAWRSILPPVVLGLWPCQSAPAVRRATTVANWRSYGSIEHDGVQYGQKAHSFRRLAGLAAKSPVPLVVALAIDPGDEPDRRLLVDSGWEVLPAADVAGDPERYQRFVQQSWAELGVAKRGYVVGRTGWFSDRSACYLASGRPVIVEDTGLDALLPVGEGVLVFSGIDDALGALDELGAHYDRHARAARAFAERHLDARRVLARLVEEAA